jgi:hypothetical protein
MIDGRNPVGTWVIGVRESKVETRFRVKGQKETSYEDLLRGQKKTSYGDTSLEIKKTLG